MDFGNLFIKKTKIRENPNKIQEVYEEAGEDNKKQYDILNYAYLGNKKLNLELIENFYSTDNNLKKEEKKEVKKLEAPKKEITIKELQEILNKNIKHGESNMETSANFHNNNEERKYTIDKKIFKLYELFNKFHNKEIANILTKTEILKRKSIELLENDSKANESDKIKQVLDNAFNLEGLEKKVKKKKKSKKEIKKEINQSKILGKPINSKIKKYIQDKFLFYQDDINEQHITNLIDEIITENANSFPSEKNGYMEGEILSSNESYSKFNINTSSIRLNNNSNQNNNFEIMNKNYNKNDTNKNLKHLGSRKSMNNLKSLDFYFNKGKQIDTNSNNGNNNINTSQFNYLNTNSNYNYNQSSKNTEIAYKRMNSISYNALSYNQNLENNFYNLQNSNKNKNSNVNKNIFNYEKAMSLEEKSKKINNHFESIFDEPKSKEFRKQSSNKEKEQLKEEKGLSNNLIRESSAYKKKINESEIFAFNDKEKDSLNIINGNNNRSPSPILNLINENSNFSKFQKGILPNIGKFKKNTRKLSPLNFSPLQEKDSSLFKSNNSNFIHYSNEKSSIFNNKLKHLSRSINFSNQSSMINTKIKRGLDYKIYGVDENKLFEHLREITKNTKGKFLSYKDSIVIKTIEEFFNPNSTKNQKTEQLNFNETQKTKMFLNSLLSLGHTFKSTKENNQNENKFTKYNIDLESESPYANNNNRNYNNNDLRTQNTFNYNNAKQDFGNDKFKGMKNSNISKIPFMYTKYTLNDNSSDEEAEKLKLKTKALENINTNKLKNYQNLEETNVDDISDDKENGKTILFLYLFKIHFLFLIKNFKN